MFRRSARRAGHQLIQEPMGNEHNTVERGKRTFAAMSHELRLNATVAAATVAAALYCIRRASLQPVETVSSTGTVSGTTK